MLNFTTVLRHRLAIVCGLAFITMMVVGCEFRRTATLHTVEYRSGSVCTPSPNACPWSQLEKDAESFTLVNCLLAGAVTLQDKQPKPSDTIERVVTPVPPRYGYEQLTAPGDGDVCGATETVCTVASKHDRKLTWANCGTTPARDVVMRGGENLTNADALTENTVVTGTLAEATNEFHEPDGLDGPDQFYAFTLTETKSIEAAVAANAVYWTDIGPLSPSPWQPGLSLLTTNGEILAKGEIFRAGITSLRRTELAPGQYVLVVDSSTRELSRGDGIYRLYVGLDLTRSATQ